MSKLFRRFLAASAAALVLTTASMPTYAAAERFTDVKPGAWYYTAVDYAVSEKLFSGTSSNTFSPNTPMTRAMFVRVLGNKANVDPAVISWTYPKEHGIRPMFSGRQDMRSSTALAAASSAPTRA